MSDNQAFYAPEGSKIRTILTGDSESELILALQVEYTRSFICSGCGFEEYAIPVIPLVGGDFIPLIFGSAVDFCTNCSKLREEHEETTDSPADYYESAEGNNDHDLQAKAQDPEAM